MSTVTGIDGESLRLTAFLYPLGVWAVMAVVAVLNGIFREVVLVPRVGEYAGHVASTGLLVAAILLVSFAFFSVSPIAYAPLERALVGALWTVLTVGFEFLVGYVEGTPVSVTIGQYDVLAGQVWIAVPIALLVSPLLFGWYCSG